MGSVCSVIFSPLLIMPFMAVLLIIYVSGYYSIYTVEGKTIWGDKGFACLDLSAKGESDLFFWTFVYIWNFVLMLVISTFVVSVAAALWYNNQ